MKKCVRFSELARRATTAESSARRSYVTNHSFTGVNFTDFRSIKG